jgi:uncharacterized membrane protein YebE (DUF533 family)
MAWLSERPAALASRRTATDILSEISQLIGKAANPVEHGSQELWSRAGDAARQLRSRAGEVARELAPYGRAGTEFARRHGTGVATIAGVVTVGIIAYYVLRSADRNQRRRKRHNRSTARHARALQS